MKTHLYHKDLYPCGPAVTYCGRVNRSSRIELLNDVRRVTCKQCRRAMVRDWSATCGRLLVAGEPEDVCACNAREAER